MQYARAAVLRDLLVFAATEGEETSKLPFYVLGGALAVWAVLVSAVGITRHETFPPSRGVASVVMLISTVLVVGAMGATILTS